MAVVYASRDVRLGRRVALKVLIPQVASPAAVAAFQREIGYALRLEHPNILPVLDAGEAEGLPFYVMRYVSGGSLRLRLQREGPFALRPALPIVRQTAAALAYAHDRRILHCDVKPENILLDGGHVYLADFGISRAIRPDGLGTGRAPLDSGGGTAGYVSPEQAVGQLPLDGRADLYSLACMTFEMLVGRTPRPARSDPRVTARRAGSAPSLEDLPRTVPDGVRAAMARALSWAPERRQPRVADFAAALEASAPQAGGSLLRKIRRILTLFAGLPRRERDPSWPALAPTNPRLYSHM